MDEGMSEKFQRLLNNQLLQLTNVILVVEKIPTQGEKPALFLPVSSILYQYCSITKVQNDLLL